MISFKVVIPARYASSRLPGKPLLDIAGKPMIEHVYEKAIESGAEEVIIATDDERIAEAASKFNASVCMTSDQHPSGTDRIAEVASIQNWGPEKIVVNVQGDEPMMIPALIRQVAEDLNQYVDAGIATLSTPITSHEELFNPNVIKVVMDHQGYALYFSRAPVPWHRDGFAKSKDKLPEDAQFYRHVGLYAYRVDFLNHYSQLTPCIPEQAESLEQLRAMYHGIRIHSSLSDTPPEHGVDTQEDLERVTSLLRNV